MADSARKAKGCPIVVRIVYGVLYVAIFFSPIVAFSYSSEGRGTKVSVSVQDRATSPPPSNQKSMPVASQQKPVAPAKESTLVAQAAATGALPTHGRPGPMSEPPPSNILGNPPASGVPSKPIQRVQQSVRDEQAKSEQKLSLEMPPGGAAAITFPPPIEVGPKTIPLNTAQKKALKISKSRRNDKIEPMQGRDGSVVYMYGHSQPFVICSPGHWCSIMLEPGEIIPSQGVFLTDDKNWFAKLDAFGSGRNIITAVRVLPKYPDTQAQIAFGTNKGRNYVVDLRSVNKDYVSSISFSYPDDEVAKADTEYRRATQKAENGGVDITTLSSSFEIEGNAWFRPVAVYTDGSRTVIDFGKTLNEVPVLVELGNDGGLFSSETRSPLNVTLTGTKLVVDGVINRAALVTGVGDDQTEIIITRRG